MKYILNFQDIELASPIFLWIGLSSAFLVLAYRFFSRYTGRKKSLQFAEVENSLSSGFPKASIGYWVKTALIALVIILTGVILSGPYTYSFEGSIRVESKQKLRTTVAALDVSGSMGMKGKFEDIKYNIVRDSLAEFLEQAENTRASVIFFSTNPTPIRWFTRDTKSLASDIRNLEMVRTPDQRHPKYAYLGQTQVRTISGGTHTPDALGYAGYMLESLEMSDEELSKSASIILFSDLQDNLEKVTEQVRAFTTKGIRVYVVTVAYQGQIDKFTRGTAGTNGLVKVFKASDKEDIENAFREIGELESSAITVEETTQSLKSLTPEFSLFLLGTILVLIFLSEGVFHVVKGGENEQF